MRLWRPRTGRELYVQGYGDRLVWFSAMVGLVIGILGVASLVFLIVETALSLRRDYAVEALNVGLERLRLQQAGS